jgi:hypothetical protein
MKKIKTILLMASLPFLTLIVQIFGQWFEQKTGLTALPFYMISTFSSFLLYVLLFCEIWEIGTFNQQSPDQEL